jgi:isopentenyl-diphosphate delta-isomerase
VTKPADSEEQVVLVDEDDRVIGTEGKTAAHVAGNLHRAVSVFVFNTDGSLLLQQRAQSKYHSGGLWSNTCCGHPRPDEEPDTAAHRRLQDEMGFDCPLQRSFGFVYQRQLDGGLVEHEYDHVFIGHHDGAPSPTPAEVADWRWAAADEVQADLAANPDRYTAWFGLALEKVLEGSGERGAGSGRVSTAPRSLLIPASSLLPRSPHVTFHHPRSLDLHEPT